MGLSGNGIPQPLILLLRFNQDRNVRVGDFPQAEEMPGVLMVLNNLASRPASIPDSILRQPDAPQQVVPAWLAAQRIAEQFSIRTICDKQ